MARPFAVGDRLPQEGERSVQHLDRQHNATRQA
jgi:hypothetical protein